MKSPWVEIEKKRGGDATKGTSGAQGRGSHSL